MGMHGSMRDGGAVTDGVAAGDESAEALRAALFTGLDRLAFALELEACRAIEARDEAGARRLEDQRLGVRLAQRYVAGVHADEVDPRIESTRSEYDGRTSVPAASGSPEVPGAGVVRERPVDSVFRR